jgi:hypothetical protein
MNPEARYDVIFKKMSLMRSGKLRILPIDCINSSRGRSVLHAGFAAVQDDIRIL